MRRGVSLLEVMFAILVVAIGLLAALTVFPVASAIAKKGQTADMVAVHGRAAIHDFDTRGMRQPARWMAWNPTAGAYQQYSPVFGESYCIDPRGIAANPTAQLAISRFPYSATATQPAMRRLTLDQMRAQVPYPPHFEPARDLPEPFDDTPARTVSGGILEGPFTSGLPLSAVHADSIFMFSDDLSVVRPEDSSLPGHGTFEQGDADNDGTPDFMTKRSTAGHLSWMATLAPRLELYAGPAVVANPEYVLSVVVFHDRPGDMTAGDPIHERVVHCDFIDAGGTGSAGGEVFLTWTAPQNTANDVLAAEVLKVRQGDWIMLAGFVPHVFGGEASHCCWYRATEADRVPEYHAAEGHYAIAASLSGPDWAVTPNYSTLYGESATPGTPPIAVLMTGVVGVYEKTISISAN